MKTEEQLQELYQEKTGKNALFNGYPTVAYNNWLNENKLEIRIDKSENARFLSNVGDIRSYHSTSATDIISETSVIALKIEINDAFFK